MKEELAFKTKLNKNQLARNKKNTSGCISNLSINQTFENKNHKKIKDNSEYKSYYQDLFDDRYMKDIDNDINEQINSLKPSLKKDM